MKIVVDTNILFSFFKRGSVLRELILSSDIILYSPEFALRELEKYKRDIIDKLKLSDEGYAGLRVELSSHVRFIAQESYSECFEEAGIISPDPKDVDFLALAMRLKLPLWSNDSKLKAQDRIPVLSIKDLLAMPEFFDLLPKEGD